MTSWRENTTQQTQDDFDELVNTVLPFAQRWLSKHGAFFPFGAVVTLEGESRVTSAYWGEEQPPSTDVLTALYAGTRGERGTLRAVAFVADVRTTDGDAILIELEASDSAPIRVVVPYKRSRLTKRLALGAMSVQPGEAHVWHV